MNAMYRLRTSFFRHWTRTSPNMGSSAEVPTRSTLVEYLNRAVLALRAVTSRVTTPPAAAATSATVSRVLNSAENASDI